ncbi:tetratricopeptide repeat protein [uncultured Spongiibacter sp.]|uniref:TPR end-of-group domain-containing protein n=1 Tax=uncultured Spongiibacter sp. TaxID=870896 RepID=UPI002590BA23|nr:tetratricopeptide repeat protein [uncultured Spongiibacter sp.]
MRGLTLCWMVAALLPLMAFAASEQEVSDEQIDQHIDQLQEPLYSPFIERYILDEVRSLRMDMERKHRELTQEVVDRELGAADKAVSYATNTVTYFFYLIAGVSSALVLIGWNSLRDIRDKVHSVANEQVAEIVEEYEKRLRAIEKQLKQETAHIESNREEINRTQEIHSLWLRASQEASPAGKIGIYDQILAIRPSDIEAITYKADAALDQGEPQWAVNLCNQALSLDETNGHAFYQLACAHSAMGNLDDAARYFAKAVAQAEAYREELERDPALESLREHPLVHELLEPTVNDNI